MITDNIKSYVKDKREFLSFYKAFILKESLFFYKMKEGICLQIRK